MSHNIGRTGVALIVIALIVGAAGGFIVGNNNDHQPKPEPVTSLTVREFLEPYTGVGSGVYKHGTIVRLNDQGQPTVIGNFSDETGADHPGTWVLRKQVTR
jgi:hypothetical protein